MLNVQNTSKECFKTVNKFHPEYEINQIIIFIIYFGLIYFSA